jgi:hypothetical protein
MDKQKFTQLSNEIEELQNWIVDHPNADYFAKKEVLVRWNSKVKERNRLLNNDPQSLKNTFNIN